MANAEILASIDASLKTIANALTRLVGNEQQQSSTETESEPRGRRPPLNLTPSGVSIWDRFISGQGQPPDRPNADDLMQSTFVVLLSIERLLSEIRDRLPPPGHYRGG